MARAFHQRREFVVVEAEPLLDQLHDLGIPVWRARHQIDGFMAIQLAGSKER